MVQAHPNRVELLRAWQQQLQRWIPRMTLLVGQQQWGEVGRLAREMDPQLAMLARHPEVKQRFIRELTLLKQLCQLAWNGTVERSQALERNMVHLRNNREGLRAYQEMQPWS